MIMNNIIGRLAVVSVCILLANRTAHATFTYPTVNSIINFHAGDTVNVSWTSSFRGPTLSLFGGYNEKRERSCHTFSRFGHLTPYYIALFTRSVPKSGSYEIPLDEGWVYPNCYLEVAQGSSNFRTNLFEIQDTNEPSTTWGPSPTSDP